jgi:hypothetical protein
MTQRLVLEILKELGGNYKRYIKSAKLKYPNLGFDKRGVAHKTRPQMLEYIQHDRISGTWFIVKK